MIYSFYLKYNTNTLLDLSVISFMLELFFPKYCILCNRSSSYLCYKCIRTKLNVNFKNICHVCGQSCFTSFIHTECEDSTNLDRLLFFCEYSDQSKKLIETFKYRHSRVLGYDLGFHLAKYLEFKCLWNNKNDFVITFVPSHTFKRNERGFNQSELLAIEVSLLTGIKFETILKKVINNKKQAGSSKELRDINLRNSFKISQGSLSEDLLNKVIIIVDDVHTTGATLNECAKVLKAAGCPKVWGLTFAKSLNYSFADGLK